MRLNRYLLALLAFMATAGQPVAQTTTLRLDPIVVTPTLLPTRASQVASSVSVITSEEIERKQYRSVAEALGSLPSVTVVRTGGPGTTTSIFSRGSEANHTLVLIDGIRVNDPSTTDGRADLAGIPIDDVERIEVLYGSQGTLYGSDAIGAVIDIITKKGKGAPKLTARAEGGSFESASTSAGLTGASQGVRYALNAQARYVGGLSATAPRLAPPGRSNDDDPFASVTVSSSLGFSPAEPLDVELVARHTRSRSDLDVNTSAPQSDDDSFGLTDRTFLRGAARLELYGGRTEHTLSAAYSRHDRLTKDKPDPVNPADSQRDSAIGTVLRFALKNDVEVTDNHVATVGIETEEQTIDASLVSDSAFGPFSSMTKADARTNSVYVQDQMSYFERIFATLGVRVDHHDAFGTEITWRVAPAYRHLETGTKVRGAYATGFHAPSLFELYASSSSTFGVFTGNPNLKPEESASWEAGVDQTLLDGRAEFGVTYHETEIKNLIESGATTNFNVSRAEIWGVELSGHAAITPELDAAARYSYTVAVNKDADVDLRRRPRHSGTVDVTYRPMPGLSLTASGIYVGARDDVDAVTFATIEMPPYFVANLAAQYRVCESVVLFGRIENLFDRRYEDPNGSAQPGIGGFAGLRAEW